MTTFLPTQVCGSCGKEYAPENRYQVAARRKYCSPECSARMATKSHIHIFCGEIPKITGGRVKTKTLWSAYQRWCKARELKPISKSSFTMALHRHLACEYVEGPINGIEIIMWVDVSVKGWPNEST